MNIEWDPQQVGITAGEVYDHAGGRRAARHVARGGRRLLVPRASAGDSRLAIRSSPDGGSRRVLRQAPKGIAAKALSAPAADLAGRWDVEVQYSRGHARHSLLLVTSGNTIEGSHVGRRLQGAVRGEIDGDRVRLRSSLPFEGTRLSYRFDGRLAGETIEGEVDLGEYGKARWTARRQG